MPVLANNRRELFAQLLVQGFSAVDAYEQAGFKRHDGNASTLSRHPEIEARLEEIRGELSQAQTGFPVGTNVIAARANITPDRLIQMADEFRQAALKSGQCGAGIRAVAELGILSGHRVERAEIGAPGEFDQLSDEELERMLVERFKKLFRPKLAISDGSITLDGRVLVSPSDDDD
jgi:hypothetical protein